jgi:hypothetical protein
MLRSDPERPWTVPQLQRELAHRPPVAIVHALARLQARGVATVDAGAVSLNEPDAQRETVELLAAPVRHTLLQSYPYELTTEAVATDCERDPEDRDEREEVELALRWLAADQLAERRDEGWAATRLSARAEELTF